MKKEYIKPKIEVIEMESETQLLASSSESDNWWDDKPENVCGNGHNPHCFLDN